MTSFIAIDAYIVVDQLCIFLNTVVCLFLCGSGLPDGMYSFIPKYKFWYFLEGHWMNTFCLSHKCPLGITMAISYILRMFGILCVVCNIFPISECCTKENLATPEVHYIILTRKMTRWQNDAMQNLHPGRIWTHGLQIKGSIDSKKFTT
jgi:hypothetical protein